MQYEVKDLAGKTLEEVTQIISEAADLSEREKEDRDANTSVISMETIAIGSAIVYMKDNQMRSGIVRGYAVVVTQAGFTPSHGTTRPSEYLIEYSNGSSSYMNMDQIFLTKKEALETMFGAV